ncbi:MAG: hypothetical protein AABX70_06360 [Nanoarchaeota archaeon]
MKCSAHGELLSNLCNWCGTKICTGCMDDADGKKYCADCNTKVSKAPRMSSQEGWGSAPTERIKNHDDTLSEERIQEIRNSLAKRAH